MGVTSWISHLARRSAEISSKNSPRKDLQIRLHYSTSVPSRFPVPLAEPLADSASSAPSHLRAAPPPLPDRPPERGTGSSCSPPPARPAAFPTQALTLRPAPLTLHCTWTISPSPSRSPRGQCRTVAMSGSHAPPTRGCYGPMALSHLLTPRGGRTRIRWSSRWADLGGEGWLRGCNTY